MIGDKLLFIQITVENELSAYTVFETLNARGLELTTTDLLKNFLFANLHNSQHDIDIAKRKWVSIINNVSLDKFPTFLRHYWIKDHELVRKEGLFKKIKNEVNSKQEVFSLLEKIDDSSTIYAGFSNYNDSLWSSNKRIKDYIRELNVFQVTQVYPILLSAWEKFSEATFEQILRICSVISFRYIVIGGLNTNIFERLYNQASIKICNGEITNAQSIFSELKQVYIPDEAFISAFKSKQIPTRGQNKRLARYILFKIESHLSGKEIDFETDIATIEHILPENANALWSDVFDEELYNESIYRIGNYTLLEESINRQIGNASYNDKRNQYSNSKYELSNKLMDYPDWTITQIEARQEKLSKIASEIWRLDY